MALFLRVTDVINDGGNSPGMIGAEVPDLPFDYSCQGSSQVGASSSVKLVRSDYKIVHLPYKAFGGRQTLRLVPDYGTNRNVCGSVCALITTILVVPELVTVVRSMEPLGAIWRSPWGRPEVQWPKVTPAGVMAAMA